MAVSKALCKSTALRRGRRVDELLREANAEIARENPDFLFVTVFAGVLDVLSGRLEYCSAGHEPPFALTPEGEIAKLAEGGGPPLCVLEGFSYAAAEHEMSRGGIICVVSDGVTEAMNPAGELYGAGRLRNALERARKGENPAALVNSIRADIAQFVDGAEPADDLTLLVLRWNGPSAR